MVIFIVKTKIIITIQICVPFRQVSLLMLRRYKGIFLLFDTRILNRYEIPQLLIISRKKKRLAISIWFDLTDSSKLLKLTDFDDK